MRLINNSIVIIIRQYLITKQSGICHRTNWFILRRARIRLRTITNYINSANRQRIIWSTTSIQSCITVIIIIVSNRIVLINRITKYLNIKFIFNCLNTFLIITIRNVLIGSSTSLILRAFLIYLIIAIIAVTRRWNIWPTIIIKTYHKCIWSALILIAIAIIATLSCLITNILSSYK